MYLLVNHEVSLSNVKIPGVNDIVTDIRGEARERDDEVRGNINL